MAGIPGTSVGAAPDDEYTMLGFKTQVWMTASIVAPCESAGLVIVSGMGMIKDLADPDRAFVEIRVAERHCEIPGMVPKLDLQRTCHFRSVTAAVLKLKKPICA